MHGTCILFTRNCLSLAYQRLGTRLYLSPAQSLMYSLTSFLSPCTFLPTLIPIPLHSSLLFLSLPFLPLSQSLPSLFPPGLPCPSPPPSPTSSFSPYLPLPPPADEGGTAPFLPVSQETYSSHTAPITHCKFSPIATRTRNRVKQVNTPEPTVCDHEEDSGVSDTSDHDSINILTRKGVCVCVCHGCDVTSATRTLGTSLLLLKLGAVDGSFIAP